MSSSYRLELNRWLANLDVKADRLLDLGGSQEPLKGRTKSWEVKEYIIADLPQPHKDSPKPDIEFNLNIDYYDINNQSVHRYEDDIRWSFDVIFCLEVMDYVWNPVSALNNIATLMTDEGSAWISFPAFYPHHQPIEDDALRYMEGGIKKISESAGLEIVQMIKRRPETDYLDKFYSAERMRAAKHFDHFVTGYICEFRKIG